MIQLIKLTPNYPNQIVNFVANNQNFTLNLRFIGYTNLESEPQAYINKYAPPLFFASITCNNVIIVSNAPVINRQLINQYPSSMNGYLVAVNAGEDNPNIENLGVTCFFYYVDDIAEIDNL